MEPRVTQQDVKVEGLEFRLSKMDARTGAWLFSVLSGKAAPNGERIRPMQLVTQFHRFTKDEFDLIQTEALKRVHLLESHDGNVFPKAIINESGAFVAKEIEFEPKIVFDVTVQSIMFNVLPFFAASESDSAKPGADPQDSSR